MRMFSGFVDAYEGRAKLWKTFVFGYLVALIPITIAANIAKEVIVDGSNPNIGYTIFCAGALYYVWIAVAMWRCSPNTPHKISKIAGRVFSVFIAIQVITTILALVQLSKVA